jgi:hypothetical protein
MDAFVRRLVERLLEPSQPLSRNRHFHTFETPEGRRALKLARRLRGLARDVRRCAERGSPPEVRRDGSAEEVRIALHFDALAARRTAYLSPEEYALLRRVQGMAEALGEAPVARPGYRPA